MEIIRIPLGVYGANCYIIYSEATKEGVIVDPGGFDDEVVNFIKARDIKINGILLTHGHGDHIGGAKEFKELFNVDIFAHKEEKDILFEPDKNLSSTMTFGPISLEADVFLEDGDLLRYKDLEIEVIHTPGHSPGGVCFKVSNDIITGDSLFLGSIGRTDLYGGDHLTLLDSINEKLMVFNDDIRIHPGHGQASSIGYERKNNPFLRR